MAKPKASQQAGSLRINRKPGNPWNQFAKKPAPKPSAPSRVSSSKTLPPGKPGGDLTTTGTRTSQASTPPSSSRSLPPGNRGGDLSAQGGPLARGGKGGGVNNVEVKPVSVRDVTPPPKGLAPGQQRALPAGQTRALSPAMGGAVKTAANVGKIGARAALGRALVVGDIASVLNDNLNPNSDMNKRDAELLRRINQKAQGKYGDRFKNMNGGDSAAKGTKPTPKGVANLPKDLKAQEAALGMKAPSASKPAASKPSSGGSGGRSSGGGGGSAPSRSSSSPAPTIRNPAPQGQSKDMNKNYTDWAKANKGLAEKVKPGQAGYDAIQKALGKTTSSTSEAKPAAKNGSSSAADAAIQSLESDNRAKPFNTDKVAPKTEKERLKQLQALRNAKSKAGVA